MATEMAQTDREPESGKSRAKTIAAVAIFSALLYFQGLMWGMPNHWDVAADSLTPVGTLMKTTRDLREVTAKRYPPLHLALVRGAFVGADLFARSDAFRDNEKLNATIYIMTARLLSLVMGVGITVTVYLLTERLFGRAEAVFAAIVITLCPLTQYYAKNANLDVPYVFWLALALLFIERFLSAGSSRPLVWAGLAGVAAVCSKDQAYGFLILLAVPALTGLRRKRGSWRRALTSRHLWLAAGLSALAFILLHNVLFRPADFVEHLRVIAGPASEGWRETMADPLGQLRLLTEAILQAAKSMTCPLFAAACVGVCLAARRKRGVWMLWGPFGYWLTFLAVIGYVYPRFVLPVALTLAPFAGLALERVRRWRPRGAPAGVFVAGLALAWPAAVCGFLIYDMEADTRVLAQRWIEDNVPVSETVGYFTHMRDMPRLNRPDLDARRGAFEAGRFKPETIADRPATDDFAPGVLIASLDKTSPAAEEPVWGIAPWLLRHLGAWGRVRRPPKAAPWPKDLYRPVKTFRPCFGRFTPDVSPSAGRVIVILRRERKDGAQKRPGNE